MAWDVYRKLWLITILTELLLAGCGKDESCSTSSPKSQAVCSPTTQPAGATIRSSEPPSIGAAEPKQCVRKETVKADLLKIAVIPQGSTHEFWKSIHAGAVKAELELKGVQVVWKGPAKEDDREAQMNVVDNFVNTGVAGIALAPTDDVALARPVRDAAKAGVSVVIMDSSLKAEVCKDYASFVATDNYMGGQKGGRRLGELLQGKGNVLLLRLQIGHVSTAEREQGFLDVIKKEFPDIQLVSTDQFAGVTTETAFAKAESLLNRFPNLDGIFCPNESSTFGMLRALQESGRAGKIKFVGFDSSEKLIQAMKAGQIHGLVLQDPLNIGYTAVKTLAAYLRGETIPTRIDTGSVVATPENMNEARIKELLSPPIDKYLQ